MFQTPVAYLWTFGSTPMCCSTLVENCCLAQEGWLMVHWAWVAKPTSNAFQFRGRWCSPVSTTLRGWHQEALAINRPPTSLVHGGNAWKGNRQPFAVSSWLDACTKRKEFWNRARCRFIQKFDWLSIKSDPIYIPSSLSLSLSGGGVQGQRLQAKQEVV